MGVPLVSVVVTAHGGLPEQFRCLAAICAPDPPHEIILADGGDVDPTLAIAAAFPGVMVLHAPGQTVPQLRWAAARRATGDIIVATEARMVPTPGWWRAFADAHARFPSALVVGGVVRVAGEASDFDRGLYLSEYVAFAPGIPAGPALVLSSGNLSYTRAALLAEGDILDRGAWDFALFERWRDRPDAIRQGAAEVVFINGMTVAEARTMRYTFGRAYAADRVRQAPAWKRAVLAVGALALPLLLTGRALAAARRYRSPAATLGGVAWLVLFNLDWSAGELAGYLRGDPSAHRTNGG